MDIVGIILAGGAGRRLAPLTRVANKHLLPVYDRPMILFPLRKMVDAGLKEILIVCGESSRAAFERLLGDGSEFGIDKLTFTTQVGEDGIAAALSLAEDFTHGRRMCVILGDNLFDDDLGPQVEIYKSQIQGARILLKKVPDPERFGVPVFDSDSITRIEEKPKNPACQYAVVGIYFYDNKVFDIIRTLKPSARGEYEITDVSNRYIHDNDLTHGFLTGAWSDCGTFESLFRASRMVRERRISEKEERRD
ncbi:MAG: sugar phosphate nucleotidyltransferase [Candidatus Zixiibacteriota bacterium]